MSQTVPAITPDEAVRQLALDVHLLDELREMINKFNMFKVLKIDQYEIRHSQMLAWLLDPQENHGLGDTFLRNFLKETFRVRKIEDASSEFAVGDELLLANLKNFKIQRESHKNYGGKNRFIDIVAYDEQQKVIIIIENKIHAKEGELQTSTYRSIIESDKNYIQYKKLFIFLSATGEVADESDWINLTYAPVVNALETSLKGKTLPIDTDFFIHHYLMTIKELSDGDNRINDFCRSIYQNHKSAIDSINNNYIFSDKIDYLTTKIISEYKKEITMIFENKIGSHDIVFEELKKMNWHFLSEKAKRYQEFYTPEMDDILPPGYGYKYFFFSRKDSISVYFEILGTGKNEYENTMNAIIDYQINQKRKCSRSFNQYRRIFSKTLSFEEKNMEKEVPSKAKELIKFVCDEQRNLISALNGIALKKTCR